MIFLFFSLSLSTLYFFPLDVLKEKLLFAPQNKRLLEFQSWLVQSEDFQQTDGACDKSSEALKERVALLPVSAAQLPFAPPAVYYRLPLMNGHRCATVMSQLHDFSPSTPQDPTDQL